MTSCRPRWMKQSRNLLVEVFNTRHNHVYILSCKHVPRPIRARVESLCAHHLPTGGKFKLAAGIYQSRNLLVEVFNTRHNHVYILSCKHVPRPIRARVESLCAHHLPTGGKFKLAAKLPRIAHFISFYCFHH